MNYFINCKTEAEAKTEYRRLAMIHHPDKGGEHETFLKITDQYKSFSQKKQGNNYKDDIFEQSIDEILRNSNLSDRQKAAIRVLTNPEFLKMMIRSELHIYKRKKTKIEKIKDYLNL
jgi:hypothetical protein